MTEAIPMCQLVSCMPASPLIGDEVVFKTEIIVMLVQSLSDFSFNNTYSVF